MNNMRVSTNWLLVMCASIGIAMCSRSARADTPVAQEHEVDPWYRDGLGWGLTGGGVIAAGTGAWILVDAQAIESDANTEPTQSVREQLRDRASSRRVAGSIFGIIGLGSLVVGIVKLAIHDDREPTDRASFDIGVTRDGFFVAGRF